MIVSDKHVDIWIAVAARLKSKLLQSAYLPFYAIPALATPSVPAQTPIATATISSTLGNKVPTNYLGWSQPATEYTYFGQDAHCYSTPTGMLTNGSNTITSVSSTISMGAGNAITGTGIPTACTITNVSGSTITISNSATTAETATLTNYASGIPSTVPLSAVPSCGINSLYRQLIANWKSNRGSGSTPLFRLEEEPAHPCDWQCNQIPVGQAITGGWSTAGDVASFTNNNSFTFTASANGTTELTTLSSFNVLRVGQPVTWSGRSATIATITSGSNITLSTTVTSGSGIAFTVQTIFSGDTGYIHSFSSAAAAAAGINSPSAPQPYGAPYTVLAASTTGFSVAISYSGSQSGADDGYFSRASQWYPNQPTCPVGTLTPPQSALLDPISDLAIETGLLNVSLGVGLASSQIVNGHQFGPTTCTTTPVPIAAYSPVEVANWLTAFSGNIHLISYFELGSKRNDYSSQSTSGYWAYRASTYGASPNTTDRNDFWINNFKDVTTVIPQSGSGSTGGIPWLDPSIASNAYHSNLIGSTPSSSTPTIPTVPPSTPTNLALIGEGLGANSQHNYPYRSEAICPAHAISGITRTAPSGGSVGTTSVVLSQPSNLAATINFGATNSTTYNSSTGLVTASLATLDAITGSHTWLNNVVTVTTPATPLVSVGKITPINGFTADAAMNQQPLQVQSTSSSGFTASYPLYTHANVTDTDSGYDHAYVYRGATANFSGITGNTSLNMNGVTIASVSPMTQPATIAYTTSTGSPMTGTGSRGPIQMTALFGNITDTPLGSNGSTLDPVPVASTNYAYPPCTLLAYPSYDNLTTGYQSSNFNQVGSVLMTASSPSNLSFSQMGISDSASSGILILVTGSATSTTINRWYPSWNSLGNQHCVLTYRHIRSVYCNISCQQHCAARPLSAGGLCRHYWQPTSMATRRRSNIWACAIQSPIYVCAQTGSQTTLRNGVIENRKVLIQNVTISNTSTYTGMDRSLCSDCVSVSCDCMRLLAVRVGAGTATGPRLCVWQLLRSLYGLAIDHWQLASPQNMAS
jgi:hypothetical protein